MCRFLLTVGLISTLFGISEVSAKQQRRRRNVVKGARGLNNKVVRGLDVFSMDPSFVINESCGVGKKGFSKKSAVGSKSKGGGGRVRGSSAPSKDNKRRAEGLPGEHYSTGKDQTLTINETSSKGTKNDNKYTDKDQAEEKVIKIEEKSSKRSDSGSSDVDCEMYCDYLGIYPFPTATYTLNFLAVGDPELVADYVEVFMNDVLAKDMAVCYNKQTESEPTMGNQRGLRRLSTKGTILDMASEAKYLSSGPCDDAHLDQQANCSSFRVYTVITYDLGEPNQFQDQLRYAFWERCDNVTSLPEDNQVFIPCSQMEVEIDSSSTNKPTDSPSAEPTSSSTSSVSDATTVVTTTEASSADSTDKNEFADESDIEPQSANNVAENDNDDDNAHTYFLALLIVCCVNFFGGLAVIFWAVRRIARSTTEHERPRDPSLAHEKELGSKGNDREMDMEYEDTATFEDDNATFEETATYDSRGGLGIQAQHSLFDQDECMEHVYDDIDLTPTQGTVLSLPSISIVKPSMKSGNRSTSQPPRYDTEGKFIERDVPHTITSDGMTVIPSTPKIPISNEPQLERLFAEL